MNSLVTYLVLLPGDEPTGAYVASDAGMSIDLAADALALHWGFSNRDALLRQHPGLIVGYATLH